jgi:murein DD-endopeptidase MepM/ murein hydrolase activator NlpD
LVRKLALVIGVATAGLVGLNWDAIAGGGTSRTDISPASLEDPVTPLYRTGFHGTGFSETGFQGTEFPAAVRAAGPDFAVETPEGADIRLNLTETFSWTTHVVGPGETISGIAARHSLSQGSIIALNDVRESWNLQAGRTLKIPNMDGVPYAVRENDTLEAIAARTGIPLNVLLDSNDIRDENVTPGQLLFIPGGRMDADELRSAITRPPERPMIRPVAGRITSGFGWREDPFKPGSGVMELHRAVDLAGNVGDPVRAAMRGTVFHRGSNPVMGNFVVLQHGDYQTLYAHLSSFSVRLGETVRQGQEIGRIGDTGRATAPHLHFAVFHKGEPVNPVDRWR